MGKKEVGIKRSMELDAAVRYLQDLTECLKKGEVYVQQGNEFLALRPKDTIFLEVKAKTKKDREKFTFSMGWYNESLVAEGEDIKITSDRPEGDVVEIDSSDDDDDE